ncbi:hypothetical protein DPMN_122736 [Dreissena polymorpha]|uniref:Uncharacterized protein n=1 Tax=Dreissena polymorpha TaxID=45954 RepID=A0A9D4JUG7_DREPO|nr:hypothetical protein DPMN_122736 [Dreissena polymorpha]
MSKELTLVLAERGSGGGDCAAHRPMEETGDERKFHDLEAPHDRVLLREADE